MAKLKPPVVFVGPSLSMAEACAALPQAEFLPPAARGDLYRARFFNASILVFIDGVFHERLSPSPREVVDVARDGALIVGASSLGAIRAAECWPAGVRGCGAVYRLYREGRLHSDDEVAVVFDPRSGRALSVPMINVRYAVKRALKARLLLHAEAKAIIEAANGLFYADRTWAEILTLASLQGRTALRRCVESQDLKRSDALRALNTVRRWIEKQPDLARHHARRTTDSFQLTEHMREPAADPLLGRNAADAQRSLTIWLLASGRYRRYVDALVAQTDIDPMTSVHGGENSTDPRAAGLRVRLERKRRRSVLKKLMTDLDALGRVLWHELQFAGELDAELFRWMALRQFAEGVETTTPMERHHAELRILAEHGLETWKELQDWAVEHALPEGELEQALRLLAAAATGLSPLHPSLQDT